MTRPERAPDPFGSALHAVASDLGRKGKELSLQSIGAALRARMGVEAYTASVGSSLKRRIEREPGWHLIAARPSINILVRDEPASTASGEPAPVTSESTGHQDAFPGVLDAVVSELEAVGRPLALTEIGDRMRQRLDVDVYKAMVRKPLGKLVAEHGWIVTEEQVGRLVIHRPDSADN